jgi:hypothetical protein
LNPSGCIKCRYFLELLRNRELLREDRRILLCASVTLILQTRISFEAQCFSEDLMMSGIEPGTSGSAVRNSDH